MIIEIAGGTGLAVVGWLVQKQLEVNKQVTQHAEAIKDLIENSNHTRGRVDAIYDHLVNRAGSNQGRG